MKRLGIDIGKVIINRWQAKEQGLGNEPEIPGAIDSIRSIVKALGRENVFLISACNDEGMRNLQWFKRQGFFERTGFDPINARFCDRRGKKAGIAHGLGLTDFLDDRIGVLRRMTKVETLWNFRPKENTAELPDHGLGNLRIVESWKTFLEAFKPSNK